MNSKQLQYKTDTIFINSKNRETSDPHPTQNDKFELPDGSHSV